MPDRKPWLLDDRALSPYLEREPPVPHAVDQFLTALASPAVARLVPWAGLLRRRAAQVEALAADMSALDGAGLIEAAWRIRPRLAAEGLTPALVARCFALVREASRRHLGLVHFPVQIMGGWAMLNGNLAEMATGEGKTLTAALPAATAALAGMPVHILTVNDYLAERDAEQLKSVYAALGLSVGCVRQPDDEVARRAAYAADITYVTGKELGFDYLRDQLALARRRGQANPNLERLFLGTDTRTRLNGLGFALVDEADSILIDEARTPLIIATQDATGDQFDYGAALLIAARLMPGEDYNLLAERKSAELTDTGRAHLAVLIQDLPGVWRYRRAREEIACQALAALHLYERDREYILRDGKVEIVDEYTGRVADGRKWEHGLHQLIEAKEEAERSPRDQTSARVTYQALFRRYARLAGMTGTAAEHRAELWSIYGLRVVRIPTNRPVRRTEVGRAMFHNADSRWDAVAETAARLASEGRPVLIGTRSVAASEEVGRRLATRGLEHTVLNARQDHGEAEIVAAAGQPGRITVATNMAGRGTDIRLAKGIAECGGLHVILTEYHESPRIDRQLIGRCGRQGDPGTWQVMVSLADPLFELHAPATIRLMRVLGLAGTRLSLEISRRIAQWAAERLHARDRRTVLRAERHASRQLAFAGGRRT